MKINRRRFNSILATGVGAIATPISVVGQSKPQVVVVGGGAGGATAARYLAANDKVDVTLIELRQLHHLFLFQSVSWRL